MGDNESSTSAGRYRRSPYKFLSAYVNPWLSWLWDCVEDRLYILMKVN